MMSRHQMSDYGCHTDPAARQKMEFLLQHGLLSTAIIEAVSQAVPFAGVLRESGIMVIEVLFRTDVSAEALAAIKEAYPDMLVGAGTIKRKEQVDEALKARADFIVSAGYNPEVGQYCRNREILHIPGAITPTEIEKAVEDGYRVLKYYPAEMSGGIARIAEICNTYPEVRFITTGGINLNNVARYFASPKVLAVGGTFMAPVEYIASGEWDTIRQKCGQTVRTALGITPLGVYEPERGAMSKEKRLFLNFFGSEHEAEAHMVEKAEEYLCGLQVEGPCLVYLVNDIYRTICYFQREGICVENDSIVYDSKGYPEACCLKHFTEGCKAFFMQRL